jgi:hypothetical protein
VKAAAGLKAGAEESEDCFGGGIQLWTTGRLLVRHKRLRLVVSRFPNTAPRFGTAAALDQCSDQEHSFSN